jgi:drug/metabolite transporter (DMT)-like permease
MYLGFFAWYRGLSDAGTARGSQVQQLQAIMTLGWAALLLNEKVTPLMLLIALGVIASVLWALMSRRKPAAN